MNGVVSFIESLGVDAEDAKKLRVQKVDGAALLEMTEEKLCDRCAVPLGSAGAILRAIAPAKSATLTIYPPKKKKGDANNPIKVTLTPADFRVMFNPLHSPLRLLNSSGSVLRVVITLEEAVALSREGMFLHASRSYDDDLVALNGFATNSATALEQKSTRALAGNAALLDKYGTLELVNSGELVELRLSHRGRKTLELAPDGLVVSLQSPVVIFNSAKSTPSLSHVDEVLEDVTTLVRMLADWGNVTTDPPEVKAQLRGGHLSVLPFLSGDNFSAVVEAKCYEKGIGIVRPSGEGFIVIPSCQFSSRGNLR